jgi:signal peptidase I
MQPCARVTYIKRVIALAGDTVEVRCNALYVNGARVAEQVIEPQASYRDYDEHDGKWFERRCSRYRETHGGHTYDVFHDEDRPKRATDMTTGDSRDFPQRDRMFAPSCHQSDYYEPKPGATKQPIGKLVVTKQDAQPCEQQAHFVVPPNALFVMGDNRNNANDSRVWGAVSVDAVVGRAIGVYYSHPPHADIDWGRVGAVH